MSLFTPGDDPAVPPDLPDWRFDELAHAGREHLDADYVATYEEKSPTDSSEDIAVLRALGIGATSIVIDLGAGTGAFARAIAPYVARVVAVDVSEPMVAAMRAHGIDAMRAGFLSYEHDGTPPDAVFTRNALHHLPDFWKAIALERLGRLLRPGGVLRLRDLVYSFEPTEAEVAITEWLAAAPDDPRAGWTTGELAEHVREEHSTFTWLLEPMLERDAVAEMLESAIDDGRLSPGAKGWRKRQVELVERHLISPGRERGRHRWRASMPPAVRPGSSAFPARTARYWRERRPQPSGRLSVRGPSTAALEPKQERPLCCTMVAAEEKEAG